MLRMISGLSSYTPGIKQCGDRLSGSGGHEVSSEETKELVEPVTHCQCQSLVLLDSASKSESWSLAEGVVMEQDNIHSEGRELQKLNGILKELRGRLVGRDKDDVEKALCSALAMEVMLLQRGHNKFAEQQKGGQVRKLALHVEQVANESKAILEETRAVAWEIETAQETMAKLQNLFQDHVREQIWEAAAVQKELEELKRAAQEGQRIKMLHAATPAADLERQIRSLRQQLLEKAAETVTLRRLLELIKERERNDHSGKSLWYELAGRERLGATLTIVPINNRVTNVSTCKIQWYQVTADSKATNLIASAVKPQYAPAPFDVGKILRAQINLPGGKTQTVQTSGPIKRTRGLDEYVDNLVKKAGAQFSVRIVRENGETLQRQPLCTFGVDSTHVKLCKSHSVKAKAKYSEFMQLCGARGGGDSAALQLFWVPKMGQSFLLLLDSERERNAAIMLSTKFAELQNVSLSQP